MDTKVVYTIVISTILGGVVGLGSSYAVLSFQIRNAALSKYLKDLPKEYAAPNNFTELVPQLKELNIEYYENAYTPTCYYVPYQLFLRVAYSSGFITFTRREHYPLLLLTAFDGVVYGTEVPA